MKALITANPPKHKDDRLIISPEQGQDIRQLNGYIDHNECDELVFDLTDYIPTPELPQYIGQLAAKLAHKGRLTMLGTDALGVASAFHNGRINILQFNQLIYGTRTKVWAFKQSLVSLHDIVELMKNNNLKIVQKRISDMTYSVIGERE